MNSWIKEVKTFHKSQGLLVVIWFNNVHCFGVDCSSRHKSKAFLMPGAQLRGLGFHTPILFFQKHTSDLFIEIVSNYLLHSAE